MFSNSVVNGALNGIVNTYGDMEVGLSTTQPYLSGGAIIGITEPFSFNGYDRAPLPTTSWDAASNRAKVTNEDILFPVPTGDWGLITYVVIYDVSSGDPIFFGPLSQAVNIIAGGNSPRIVAGGISIAFPA